MPGSSRIRVGAKWTAARPVNREKHFVVEAVRRRSEAGAENPPVLLRAILSNRIIEVEARELTDDTRWKTGWR